MTVKPIVYMYLFSRLKYENQEAIIQELIEKLYAVTKDHINKGKDIDKEGGKQIHLMLTYLLSQNKQGHQKRLSR